MMPFGRTAVCKSIGVGNPVLALSLSFLGLGCCTVSGKGLGAVSGKSGRHISAKERINASVRIKRIGFRISNIEIARLLYSETGKNVSCCALYGIVRCLHIKLKLKVDKGLFLVNKLGEASEGFGTVIGSVLLIRIGVPPVESGGLCSCKIASCRVVAQYSPPFVRVCGFKPLACIVSIITAEFCKVSG